MLQPPARWLFGSSGADFFIDALPLTSPHPSLQKTYSRNRSRSDSLPDQRYSRFSGLRSAPVGAEQTSTGRLAPPRFKFRREYRCCPILYRIFEGCINLIKGINIKNNLRNDMNVVIYHKRLESVDCRIQTVLDDAERLLGSCNGGYAAEEKLPNEEL